MSSNSIKFGVVFVVLAVIISIFLLGTVYSLAGNSAPGVPANSGTNSGISAFTSAKTLPSPSKVNLTTESFVAIGLPTGYNWSMTYGNVTEYSLTKYINFSVLPKHSYNFSVPILKNSSNGCTTIYTPLNASGSVEAGNVVPQKNPPTNNPNTPSAQNITFVGSTYCLNIFLSGSRNSNYSVVYGTPGNITASVTSSNSSILSNVSLHGTFVSSNFSVSVNGDGYVSLPYYKLAAANYTVTFWINNPLVQNVTLSLRVTKATPTMFLHSNPLDNFTYNGSSVIFRGGISTLFGQLYANMTSRYNDNMYFYELTNGKIDLPAAAAGNYTVDLYTSGNRNYTSRNISEHFSIYKAQPNLSIMLSPDTNFSYNGAPEIFKGKVSSFDNQLPASLYLNGGFINTTYTAILYSNAASGNYSFVFNTTGNQNYTAYSKSASISIYKGHPLLVLYSAPKSNFTYNGTRFKYYAQVITHNDQIGGSLYYQGNLVNNSVVNTVYKGSASAGNYSLILNTTGNSNYSGAQISLNDTIYKAVPVLKIISKLGNFTYNGSSNPLSGSGNNHLNGTITVNGNPTNSISGAGNYTITYCTPANQNYTSGCTTIYQHISKGTPSVNLNTPGNYVYNGQCSVNYSISTVGNQLNASLDINNQSSGSTNSHSSSYSCGAAGNYTATVHTNGNQNYTGVNKSGSFVIHRASPSVFLFAYPDSNLTYNGKSFEIIAEVSSINDQLLASLYLNGSLLNTTRTNISYSNAHVGNYSFVFNTTGNQNYTASAATKKIFVFKAKPSMQILLSPGDFVYNGSAENVTGLVTSFDNQINATMYINGTAVTNPYFTAGAGTYLVVLNESGNFNYTNGSISRIFTIAKAQPVLDLNVSENKYDTYANVTYGVRSLYNQLFMNLTGVSNPVLNTHNGSLVIGKSGLYKVVASTDGNANYSNASVFRIVFINSSQSSFVLPTINLSNILYRLPITIVNNNSFAVNGSFQDIVNLSSYKLSRYEFPNLSNVEFSYSNENVIPSWIESGATSTAGQPFASFQGSGYIVPSNGLSWMNSASQQFTMSLWVNPSSSSGVILDELAQAQPNTNWHDTWLDLVNGNVYMRVWNLGCVNIGSIPVGQWSNIVISYNGTSFNGYVNGVYGGSKSGTRSVPGGSSSMYYALGSGDTTNCGAGNDFSGHMSNYVVYNTSISNTSITSIYNLGPGSALIDNSTAMFMPLNSSNSSYYNISPVMTNVNLGPSPNTLYWVNISRYIPAGGQITIYANFLNYSAMNNVYTGEAPQLSSVYGEYNDIGNVMHPGLAYRFYYSPYNNKCLPSPSNIYSQNIASNVSNTGCREDIVSNVYYTNATGWPDFVESTLYNNTLFDFQYGYSGGEAFPNSTITNPNSNFAVKSIGFVVSQTPAQFNTLVDDAAFLGTYYSGGNSQNWLSSYSNSNNVINAWKGQGATHYAGTSNVIGSSRVEWLYSNEISGAYDSLWTNNGNVSYYSYRVFSNGNLPAVYEGYPTTFVPEGLPSNATWGLNMNGEHYSGQGNITVYTLPGSYSYSLSRFSLFNSYLYLINYSTSGSVNVSRYLNKTIYVNFTDMGSVYVINSSVSLASNLDVPNKALFVTSLGSLYTGNYSIGFRGIINNGTIAVGSSTDFTTVPSTSSLDTAYLYNYADVYFAENEFTVNSIHNFGSFYHTVVAPNGNQNETYSYGGSGGGAGGLVDTTYGIAASGNNGGHTLDNYGGIGGRGYSPYNNPHVTPGTDGINSPVYLPNFTFNQSLLTGAGGGNGYVFREAQAGFPAGGDGARGLIFNVSSFLNYGTIYNNGQPGTNSYIEWGNGNYFRSGAGGGGGGVVEILYYNSIIEGNVNVSGGNGGHGGSGAGGGKMGAGGNGGAGQILVLNNGATVPCSNITFAESYTMTSNINAHSCDLIIANGYTLTMNGFNITANKVIINGTLVSDTQDTIHANSVINNGDFIIGNTSSQTVNPSTTALKIESLYNYGNVYLSENLFLVPYLYNYESFYHTLVASNSGKNETYSYGGSGGGGGGAKTDGWGASEIGGVGGSTMGAPGGYAGTVTDNYWHNHTYFNSGGNGTNSTVTIISFAFNQSLLTGAGGGYGAIDFGGGIPGGKGAMGLIFNVTSFMNYGTVYNTGQPGANSAGVDGVNGRVTAPSGGGGGGVVEIMYKDNLTEGSINVSGGTGYKGSGYFGAAVYGGSSASGRGGAGQVFVLNKTLVMTKIAESGLPQGLEWSSSYGNYSLSSSQSETGFYSLTGTYNYTIPTIVTTNYIYIPNVSSGKLSASGTLSVYFSRINQTTPASIVKYSILNISNKEKAGVSGPFQEMVKLPYANFSQYLNLSKGHELQNVMFFDSTTGDVIDSWLENYTSTYALFWIKLPNGVQENNTFIGIAVGFASPSTNLFNNVTTGEAPQLSPIYGQYDNGVNVFNNYWNFAGTTMPSGFSEYTDGGGSTTINNGLTLNLDNGQSACAAPSYLSLVYNTPLSMNNSILETYSSGIRTSGPTDIGIYTANSDTAGGYAGVANTWGWGHGTISGGYGKINNPFSMNSGSGVASIYWAGQNNEGVAWNYNFVSSGDGSETYSSNQYIAIGTGHCTGGSDLTYYWLRTRTATPDGVMPSVSFNSIKTVPISLLIDSISSESVTLPYRTISNFTAVSDNSTYLKLWMTSNGKTTSLTNLVKQITNFGEYLPLGTYQITAGTNSSGIANVTHYETVVQAVPKLSLSLSPSSDYVYNTTSIKLNASISTYDNQISANLYINGVYNRTINSSSLINLGNSVGNYSIILNTTGNQNYTSNSVEKNIKIYPMPPSYITKYVLVNLTNSQNEAVNGSDQVLVNFSYAAYTGLINTSSGYAFQNVRFFDTFNAQPINSWLEYYNNATQTAAFWIKLPSGIPANSTSNEVMVGFTSPSTNLFNNITTGEAPQLSPVYGEYDNGANVFNTYFNAETPLSNFIVQGGYSLSKVTINCSISYCPSGNMTALHSTGTHARAFDYVLNNTISNEPMIVLSGTMDSPQYTGAIDALGVASMSKYPAGINYAFSNGASVSITKLWNGNFAGSSTVSGGSPVWSALELSYVPGAHNINASIATTTGIISQSYQNVVPSTGNLYIGVASATLNVQENDYVNWMATASYAPNGRMPSISFGRVING